MKNKYLFFLLISFITFNVSSQVAPLLEVNIQAPLAVCDPTQTALLTATYPTPNQTTGYTSLPLDPVFNPTFPTTGGTLLNATADDVWSPLVNLPFSFAFYGGYYNQVIVGSNGLISFNTAAAGGYCPWAFTATVPSPALPLNSIFGVYQDTNIASPPVTNPAVQNVNYYVLDTGPNAAPNRVFVVNFNQLPQFSCNNGVGLQTSQIVIHEGTNIIDIFVFDRTPCAAWNSCSGVIGVQNATGTQGSTPTGVNTGCWTSNNDHYQIVPNGAVAPVSIQWYQGGTPVNNGIPIGGVAFGALNQNPINAVPGPVGSPNLYTAVVTYTNPNGTTTTISETQSFELSLLDVAVPVDVPICTILPAPYTVNIDQSAYIVAGSATDNDPTHYSILYYTNQQDAIDDNQANAIATPGAFITSGPFPQTIYVSVFDAITSFCTSIFQFDITLGGPVGTFTYTGSPWANNDATLQPPTLSVPFTTGGTWSAVSVPAQVPVAVLNIDPVTGVITPLGSTVGIYQVNYDIAAANGCPAFNYNVLIEIIQTSCTASESGAPAAPLCIGDAVNITYNTPGATSGVISAGALPPGTSGSFTGGQFVVTGNVTTAGTFTYTVEITAGLDVCTKQTTITVQPAPTLVLAAGSGAASQSPCVNTALASNIIYTIGGSATNVTVTNLPPGMNFVLTGSTVTISGTPTTTVGSPFTYVVTATGPCGNSAPLGGTITVQQPTLIALTSGNDAQTPCVGAAISNIVYNYSGSATAIAVTGLPAGLTQTPIANGVQISGTPSAAAGIYNYTVTASGPCGNALLTGSIEIIALPVITGTPSMCVNGTTTLSSTAAPAAVNQWVSSNPAIASVSNVGVVTGNAPGTATITYTALSLCQQTVVVTVNPLPTITGTLTVCAASTTTLSSTAAPAAVNPWVSSAAAIATVSNAGVVTGVSAGTTNITYTDVNGCTAMVTVTVIALPVITGTLTVCNGLTTTLASTATPAASPWSSSNTAIASVNASGVVTGNAPGTAVITYTNINGCITTATVTVVALPSITGTLSVCQGATTTLASADAPATVNPWISSDATIASVSNTGVVTGVAVGSAVITFTNSSGCIITATVTVNPLPVITGTLTFCQGLTTNLSSISAPAAVNAWVSSNTTVATVSNTGVVTGNAAGTATITYTDANGCTATVTVTVIALPVITGTLTVCNGLTTTLSSLAPPAATNPWISSNPAIASIDSAGLVTGNGIGTATITYTNSNGCINTAVVTVTALPTITGTLTVCAGLTTTLASTATPAAVNPWTSSAPAIASVSATGVVNGNAAGTATITFTNANGCIATAVVTVNPLPIISGTLTVCVGQTTQLSGTASPAASNAWVSSNTAIATISSTGLVSGIAQGTTTITYTNSNGCVTTQTVTVQALTTIAGPALIATTCEDTAIVSATYTFGGSATGVNVDPTTTLPIGMIFNTTTGVLSGSPTTAGGPYTFDIITTGGCTPAARITVSITVNPTATITAVAPSQVVCINDAMIPMDFVFGNGATGAAITSGGLPTGVTAAIVPGNILRISGTPNSVGIFNFIITPTGGCSALATPIAGLIEVKPTATLTLISPLLSQNPSPCSGVALTTPIVYEIGNFATGATVTGLPTGMTGLFNTTTGQLTISGSSTQIGGPYTYTVTATGGCNPPSTTGAITILPSATIALTSGAGTNLPELCINDVLATNITYALSNGATSASISGILPTGITFDTATLTLSGTPTESGTFSYTVKTVGGCGESQLSGTFKVNPLPVITLPQDGFICVDDAGNPLPTSTTTLTTGLSAANHTFIWTDVNGVIAGENGNSYVATAPGVYSVEATNTTTGCSNVASTTVITSFGPQIVKAIASAYFSEEQVITVSVLPAGNYEYQLENGAWQDSNQFFNLPSGQYTVTVRDKVGCGSKDASIRIITYPKFFTPNGDGYNDRWNISDLSDQSDSKIYIFDRMGKLIKQISPQGEGWDGTFNGQPLPGTDYWFNVFFKEDGISKEFKAHFSIKR